MVTLDQAAVIRSASSPAVTFPATGEAGIVGAEPFVVATKIDKLSRAERTRNLRELERIFGKPALPVSAERGEGLEQLWTTIARVGRAADRKVRAVDEGTAT